MQPKSQGRLIERTATDQHVGLTRRALLRRGALLAGGAGLGLLLEACALAPNGASAPAGVPSGAATKLVMLDAANIDAPDMAPRKQVVTDFMAKNPDVTLDWRALPSNIQWDRVARTTVSAGEQVDLVNINGQFIRAWVRDGLLDDLSAHAQLAPAFGNVDPSFLAAQSDDPRASIRPAPHARQPGPRDRVLLQQGAARQGRTPATQDPRRHEGHGPAAQSNGRRATGAPVGRRRVEPAAGVLDSTDAGEQPADGIYPAHAEGRGQLQRTGVDQDL